MDEDLGIPGDWSCVRFVGMKSLSTLTFWLGAKLQLNPAGVCNSILIIVSLDFFLLFLLLLYLHTYNAFNFISQQYDNNNKTLFCLESTFCPVFLRKYPPL
jgi:hypothetical protein